MSHPSTKDTQEAEVKGSKNDERYRNKPEPLKVAIVGAGIGGLSAAIFFRQQGHHVTLLEQSRFTNELGAAVHLAPNANGLLKRMGIQAEDTGANRTLSFAQYKANGDVMFHVDLAKQNEVWQHQWLLAHRVHLHSELKERATADEGQGQPAVLRTSSKVVDLDTEGNITLVSGEQFHADVVVGADGVHSRTRSYVPGAEGIKTYGSGKSAFRFLMPRERVLADPETKKFAERDGHLSMFFARDRRVVIYPTSNNELLNFVCIHPTSESEVKREESSEWSQQAHKGKLLEVFKNFEPALVKLLSMADEETLKVWELLDMDRLPTWTDGRLVLIGDAAHPFTPHQGQGAGQAIEDAASLAVVLPLGTPPEEIPNRLKLYEKCRYERASRIQEYSRVVGRDLGDGPTLDANEYGNYNFGHDEWDYSTQQLRKYFYARQPNLYWRMPVSFGPMPGPRQDTEGNPRNGGSTTFTTASIRFRTSRTLLQNLFPTSDFVFSAPGTLAHATFSVTALKNLDWLGGRGYSHFGLYIHGVEYRSKSGQTLKGNYLPVLFEDLADPILSGREELGMPKLWCELDIKHDEAGRKWSLQAGWLGSVFCKLQLEELEKITDSSGLSPNSSGDEGLLWYKSIPATGPPSTKVLRQFDVTSAVFLPAAEEADGQRSTTKAWKGDGKIKFDTLDWKALPTLHHIVERLDEIPVYEVLEAKIVEGKGMSDVKGARMV